MENNTQLYNGAKLKLICTSGPTVWETDNGAVMVEFSFRTESEPVEHITDSICLIRKDGSVGEIPMNTLKSCFEWDGIDPFEIQSEGKAIEATIEHENYQGQNGEVKTSVKIKYMNPLGGSRHVPADKTKIMSKYGAIFRALSGGVPSKPKPAVAKPTQPTQPAMPKPTTQSTSEEAWNAACTKHPTLSAGDQAAQDQLAVLWTEAIQKIGKPVDKFTGADWAKVKESFA